MVGKVRFQELQGLYFRRPTLVVGIEELTLAALVVPAFLEELLAFLVDLSMQ